MFAFESVVSVALVPLTMLRTYFPVKPEYMFHCVPVVFIYGDCVVPPIALDCAPICLPPVSAAGRVPVVHMYGPTVPYALMVFH